MPCANPSRIAASSERFRRSRRPHNEMRPYGCRSHHNTLPVLPSLCPLSGACATREQVEAVSRLAVSHGQAAVLGSGELRVRVKTNHFHLSFHAHIIEPLINNAYDA